MYATGQSIQPIHSIFGSGFIPEQHADEFHPNLLERDTDRRELDFAAILQSLRAALGIRR